ncbi:MAG: uracil-DNA glycosylase family protein [Candidatus Methanoperedens sp.]|nr:uracil-DNA glycosylase family protein [Candidatus Methanoperedens sp.]
MINLLGEKLVKCNLKCEGINNNPKEGIIPRCLMVEKGNGSNSCIVVGLNPGKCNEDEKKYYLGHGIKYESLLRYFSESNLKNIPYFKKTRDLITTQLGFKGDIVWTNLVKCECKGENGKIPIQTLRVCINRFLREEVKISNCSTIFALGNEAFKFCALGFPNHFIVGIPHPKARFGDFDKFNEKFLSNPSRYINILSNPKDNNGNYKAVDLKKDVIN